MSGTDNRDNQRTHVPTGTDEVPREFLDRLKNATKLYNKNQDPDEYRRALKGYHNKPKKETKKAKSEERVPVLLQWKEKEMADEMEALMMGGKEEHASGKADCDGDVEMEDQ